LELQAVIGTHNRTSSCLDRLLKYGLIVRVDRGLYSLPE
jgi:hypothetical protein